LNDYDSEGDPLFEVELFRLHGDMEQKERTKIYFEFLNAKKGILLCTDVAARGLDLPLVDWIIQYDPPGDPKDYLHRVGRTARLDKKGNALLFLQPHEDLYKNLLEKLKLNIFNISGEEILEHLITTFKRRTEDPMEAANIMQAICEQTVEKEESLQKLSMDALDSHLKAYTTYSKNTKYIFHIKNLHQGHLAKSFALKETPTEIRKKFKPEVDAEILKEKKKNKKPSATEKLQRYKDFQKGRLPIRPKIDIPSTMKRSFSTMNNNSDAVEGLIKFRGTSNSSFSRKAQFETMSEFSSGLGGNKKKKMY
jgi:ATP-dependent RNA helicase DDX31/DBP7